MARCGTADTGPRAVGRRCGAEPGRAILEPVGGQGPQHLINEFANAIGRGEMGLALICGSEAISTVRHLAGKGETRDWSETVGGQLEDRGFGEGLVTREFTAHGARTPIQIYAMFENARRARLGQSRADYALAMGELFAPFTQVAAGNPHAMSQARYSAADLATVTPQNRLVADPFTRRLVARDQANQGAAVIIASVAKASPRTVGSICTAARTPRSGRRSNAPICPPIRRRCSPAARRWGSQASASIRSPCSTSTAASR